MPIALSAAKEKYIAFIRDNYVPVFYRDFYLDIVCDGPWDVVLYEEEQTTKAAYIYMKKQKLGFNYLIQPQLTPYTGPLFFGPFNANKAFAYLIDNLPQHQLIIQDYFHTLPQIYTDDHCNRDKHTYVVEADTDVDLLWKNQSSTHRRIIRKADRELSHDIVDDIDVFLDFVSETFDKRGKTVPNDPVIFKRLDQQLRDRGMRKIVQCTNREGRIVAMCYFMKDQNWTYNFANSVIEDYKHYGMNLILWTEIKETLSEGRSFDFEGSMIPGVDEFFKRFKGRKTNYLSRFKSANALVDYMVRLKTSKSGQ